YRDESFLPHARDEAGDPARQPVLLTMKPDNVNNAQALFLIDGAEPGDISGFERACLMFDGRAEAALQAALFRWTDAKAAGTAASYWRESAAGKWEQQS